MIIGTEDKEKMNRLEREVSEYKVKLTEERAKLGDIEQKYKTTQSDLSRAEEITARLRQRNEDLKLDLDRKSYSGQPKDSYKILIVEDKPENTESAKGLADRHICDIVDTFHKAKEKVKQAEEEGKPYDMVLTDLFFPYHDKPVDPLNGDGFTAEPQALGFPLALYAMAIGVKDVAIITDANHHSGPMHAAVDPVRLISTDYVYKPEFKEVLSTSPVNLIYTEGIKKYETVVERFIKRREALQDKKE